jgi:hypothetical protein
MIKYFDTILGFKILTIFYPPLRGFVIILVIYKNKYRLRCGLFCRACLSWVSCEHNSYFYIRIMYKVIHYVTIWRLNNISKFSCCFTEDFASHTLLSSAMWHHEASVLAVIGTLSWSRRILLHLFSTLRTTTENSSKHCNHLSDYIGWQPRRP